MSPEWLLKLRRCMRAVCGMEWFAYAALGIFTAILSFLMDLSVTKLLRGNLHFRLCNYDKVTQTLCQPKFNEKNTAAWKLKYKCFSFLRLAHQWLYTKLEGHTLLQFVCWTLYPACLCAIASSFSHNICPSSTGQQQLLRAQNNTSHDIYEYNFSNFSVRNKESQESKMNTFDTCFAFSPFLMLK